MLTHEIDDPDATMEKLLSNDTVETIPVGSDPSDPDAPPPKGQFILFDRPQSADSEHVASHDLPRQCGTLAIYGRETDRNARMSFILHKDNEFDTHVDRVCQISGQSINATAASEGITDLPGKRFSNSRIRGVESQTAIRSRCSIWREAKRNVESRSLEASDRVGSRLFVREHPQSTDAVIRRVSEWRPARPSSRCRPGFSVAGG